MILNTLEMWRRNACLADDALLGCCSLVFLNHTIQRHVITVWVVMQIEVVLEVASEAEGVVGPEAPRGRRSWELWPALVPAPTSAPVTSRACRSMP